MPCYSPLRGWKDERTGGIRFTRSRTGESMEVACGQCLGCRLDRSRMWAYRLVHEASMHDSSWFVTLTYDVMPDDRSVSVRDVQLFMKRLRKWSASRVRFFAVGEYGSRCEHCLPGQEVPCEAGCGVGRPHYHLILFGLDLPDLRKYGSRNGNSYYGSEILAKLWGLGYVVIGAVNAQSAGYCARYCLKKWTGVNAPDHYVVVRDGELLSVKEEFCVMSRRPGIGAEWFKKYALDVFPGDQVPVSGVGVVRGVPRYYEEMMKELDGVMLEEVKAARQEFKRKHPDEFEADRLLSKYKVKKASIVNLKREID